VNSLRWGVCLLPLAGLGAATLTAAQGTSVSTTALKACAAIAAPNERLSCYDQLAGRAGAVVSVSPPAATAPLAGAPTVAAPVSAGSPVSGPAPATTSAAAPAAATTTAIAAPPAAAQAPKESFGLYAAEHPTVYTQTAQTGTVIGFGVAANGRPTITLDGGQVWELDNADPLLSTGNSVTIKRASLGSFLLTTSTGRTHRVHRLQ
jgi:hypothetical protein